MSGPIIVQGKDGQRFSFPEGTSQDVMKSALQKHYTTRETTPGVPLTQYTMDVPLTRADPRADPLGPDPLSSDALRQQFPQSPAYKPSGNFNERLAEGVRDYFGNVDLSPSEMADTLGTTIMGINNAAYRGLDDEIAGKLGFDQYEATQDTMRARKPNAFVGGQAVAGMAEGGILKDWVQPKSILGMAGMGGLIGGGEALAWGTGDADAPDQNRAIEGMKTAPYGMLGGAVLGGALGSAVKLASSPDGRVIRAELQAVADGKLRPQAIKAVRRLLNASGVSDSDISAATAEVRKRIEMAQSEPSSAAARKRVFQHYMEVFEEDPASPLYNPQASANIQMTVQERANSAIRGDGSRGIVGQAVKSDRASQVPFLQESAQSISTGSRLGTKKLVETERKALSERYEAALDPSTILPQAQAEAAKAVESARPLMDGPSGLRVDAVAEGIDIDALIAQNPMKALHWIQSAARRKSKSTDPNAGAYGKLRNRLLPIIENNVPAYNAIRRDYATNEGLEAASTFGDKLFGGSNSNIMNNEGMRAELVESFQSLTPREQQIALTSIRDAALGRISGGAENAQARLTQMASRNALDFLEQIGQKEFADDIRAIAKEIQLLSVTDAGNPLRQSATFSNAQARTDAPPLYESRLANAVNDSTPGTVMGEGMLMAFAPHYQGAYAGYRLSRLLAKLGFSTNKKTLEDMTRFLMARDMPAQPIKNITPSPSGGGPSGGASNAFSQGQPSPQAAPVANAFSQPMPPGGVPANQNTPANPYIGRKSFRGAEENRPPRNSRLGRGLGDMIDENSGSTPPIPKPDDPVQNGFFGFGKKPPAAPSQREAVAGTPSQYLQSRFQDSRAFNSALDQMRSDSTIGKAEAAQIYRDLFGREPSSGASRNAIFDEIARQRRRAENIVTNGFFPKRGGDDLPMDQASRMQRAREMGFDTDTVSYRGLTRPYDPKRAGNYQMFTSSAADAGEFAGNGLFDGGNIVAAHLRKGRNLKIEGGRNNFNSIPVAQLPSDVRANLHPSTGATVRTDELAYAAQKSGYDSVTVQNVFDNAYGEIPRAPTTTARDDVDQLLAELEAAGFDMNAKGTLEIGPDMPKNYDPVTLDIVFDPKNIRSVNARFDPAKSDSPKLLDGASLESIAGTLTGLGMLGGAMSVGGEDSHLNKATRAVGNAFKGAQLPQRPIDRMMENRTRTSEDEYVPRGMRDQAAREGRDMALNAFTMRRQQLEGAAPQPIPPQDRLAEMRGRLEELLAAGEISQQEAFEVMQYELNRAGVRSRNPFAMAEAG